MKTLPCYGKLYISSRHVSFNSKGIATAAKVILHYALINGDVDKKLLFFSN